MEPTRTANRNTPLTDHILTNSPENVILSGVIEMRLSDLLLKNNVSLEIKRTLQNFTKVVQVNENLPRSNFCPKTKMNKVP